MSERHTHHSEVLETTHGETDHHAPEVIHESVNESREKSRQAEKRHKAESVVAEESAEKDSLLDSLNAEQQPDEQDYATRPIDDNLKANTFNNEIRHIRRKLGKTDKVGSKVIHQRVVRTVSEVSSKTITRPSGLLGGGITAFIGTSTYLYLAKHIGLTYNYSIFLFLLVAGFVLGLVIEAVLRMTRTKRSA